MLDSLKTYASLDNLSTMEWLMIVAIYAGYWMICVKAGTDGWRGIIPVYNSYKLFEIVAGNGMLFLTYIIPPVGAILLAYYMAKAFGKDMGFTLGLIFLPFIFLPILGFGEASYYGPKGVNDFRTEDARGASTVTFETRKYDDDER